MLDTRHFRGDSKGDSCWPSALQISSQAETIWLGQVLSN